jgi:hypothetical protein
MTAVKRQRVGLVKETRTGQQGASDEKWAALEWGGDSGGGEVSAGVARGWCGPEEEWRLVRGEGWGERERRVGCGESTAAERGDKGEDKVPGRPDVVVKPGEGCPASRRRGFGADRGSAPDAPSEGGWRSSVGKERRYLWRAGRRGWLPRAWGSRRGRRNTIERQGTAAKISPWRLKSVVEHSMTGMVRDLGWGVGRWRFSDCMLSLKFHVHTRQLVTDVVGEENEDSVEDWWRPSIGRVRDRDEQRGKLSRSEHVQSAWQLSEVQWIPWGRGEATKRGEYVVANIISIILAVIRF